MNHQEVRKRMGEYLQGDLTLAQRALFDAHLDGCDACASELSSLRRTVQLLRNLPSPEVPPHLADRVIARIEDGEGVGRWWDGLVAFWNWIDPARYLPPLAAAALTSAVVIVGVRDLGWEIPGARRDLVASPQGRAAEESARAEATASPRLPASVPSPFANDPGAPRASGLASATPISTDPAAADLEREAPSLLQGPFGARAVVPGAGASPRSPEEDLRLALEDPSAFMVRFRTLRPPEAQDAWLAAVAEHAARQQAVADVARRLRETEGDEGRALATRFEGVEQSVAYPGEGR